MAASTLTAPMTNSDTVATVASTTPYPSSGVVLIDGEQMSHGPLVTVLIAAFNADSVAQVNSTTGFPSSGTIQIDNEQITYSSLSPQVIGGVVRGVNGTTQANHAAGAAVTWIRSSTQLASLTRGLNGTTAASHSSAASVVPLAVAVAPATQRGATLSVTGTGYQPREPVSFGFVNSQGSFFGSINGAVADASGNVSCPLVVPPMGGACPQSLSVIVVGSKTAQVQSGTTSLTA